MSVVAQETYVFAKRDTMELKLDVYRPKCPRVDKACVMYVFGGGFYEGERDGKAAVETCTMLADRGFVAIAIDYRLFLKERKALLASGKVSALEYHCYFDTAIAWAVEDCSAAIAWVCDHAGMLGVDTSRIVLTGGSAGAITVASLDYCRCNSLPATAELPVGFRPAAVLPFAGAIQCRNTQLRYATPPAPTCFFHGTGDRIVHYNRQISSLTTSLFGANRIAKVFKRNGWCYRIVRLDGNGHEVAAAHPQLMGEFCAFVDAVLSGVWMQSDETLSTTAVKLTPWSHWTVFDLYLGK